MTTRILDTAIEQAVDAAQGAVHAIGDGISDLLPTQLLPGRSAPKRDRGRMVAVVSTIAIVVVGVLLTAAKRRSGNTPRPAGEPVAASNPYATANTMNDADRANGEPETLSRVMSV